MLQVTDEQKEKFKLMCNHKFCSNVEFMLISIVKNSPNIIQEMLDNNISCNYLVDKDNFVELVPSGWKTNAGYRNVDSRVSNPHSKSINILMALDDLYNVERETSNFRLLLSYSTNVLSNKLIIGDNIHVLNNRDKDHPFFYGLEDNYIVDVIFKYFRLLFI